MLTSDESAAESPRSEAGAVATARSWTGFGMDLRDKEIFNEAELMEFLGVSRTTLWKLRRQRNLPYGRVGREYRYLKSDIIRWLKESKYQTGGEQTQFALFKENE
jgi:excisionase family DNA binding protein